MHALATLRLRLRLLNDGDEALYCRLYTDADVMHRIAAPLSAEAAAKSFRGACRHNRADRPGHRFWIIEDKASDTGIGLAGLLRSGDQAEIGVMLRNGWWKRGVSSEAFVVLVDHAFAKMRLDLLYAQRPDDDHALIIDRLLAKFGFVRTPEKVEDKTVCRWELPRSRWQARRR